MARSKQIKFTAGRLWLKAVYCMLGATFSFEGIFENVLSMDDVPFSCGARALCRRTCVLLCCGSRSLSYKTPATKTMTPLYLTWEKADTGNHLEMEKSEY